MRQRTQRAIADNGLPLKIVSDWTEDVYTNQDEDGNIRTVEVKGWRVRINGKVYPRGHVNEYGEPDWTYRYSGPERRVAIDWALKQAGLTIW